MARYELQSMISIHTPREGSDRMRAYEEKKVGLFQSTLPARGATSGSARSSSTIFHFNPHSPRGERPRLVEAL